MAGELDTLVLPPAKKRRVAPLLALFGLATTAGAGVLGWERHEAATTQAAVARRLGEEARQAADALAAERKATTDLGSELSTCKDELATEQTGAGELGQRLTALELEVSSCRSSVATLEQQGAEAKRRLAEFQALSASFKKMIDAGRLDVVFRKGQMVVKLPAAILFPSGSAELSDAGKAAVAEVAAILKEVRGRRFTVAGHTDNVKLGKDDRFRSNWELSTARAVTITELLIAHGMPPARLVAAGYGEHDPLASNRSPAGRQKNRRIEIILEPDLSAALAKR